MRHASGSAIRDALEAIKATLFNERGEVGDEGEPEDANTNEGWDVEGKESPPAADPSTAELTEKPPVTEAPPGKPPESAETIKPEGAEEGKEDSEGEEGTEEEPPFHEHPRWKEQQEKLSTMEVALEESQKIAEFYRAREEERVAAAAIPGAKQPGAQGKPSPTEELPAGVKGPQNLDATGQPLSDGSGWDNQQEMAQYFDHHARQMVDNHPYFERTHEVITALQDMVIRNMHPDFDEVTKPVYEELFVLDPQGNVLAEKNKAMIEFFRAQPLPQLAMYQHGIAKKAPQKIKEGVKKQTKATLAKLEAKPKAPTEPKKTTAGGDEPELDWDMDKGAAEQVLHKRGLI